MDAQLRRGLQVKEFAEDEDVAPETILRYIHTFQRLGLAIVRKRKLGTREWYWKYPPEQHPLFVVNLTPQELR
jgi:hypothetical protein